ncbi:MAG TPA: aspartyl/asparaginyl beta-hydroxylase domain-containing protein [Allosphingosinicella sp.]
MAEAERDIRDLLARGRDYAGTGDSRAAASFFAAALRAAAAAAAAAGPLAPPLQAELDGARAYLREAAAAYQAHLERSVAGAGAGPRLDEALAMLLGRKPLHLPSVAYPQRPSLFHFPGLPQRPFYEREEFDWVHAIEAATPPIRDEVEALLARGADFRPYVEGEKDRPQADFHGLQGDPSWTAFYLWKNGSLVEENAALCPRTAEAVRRVPLSAVGSRTPSVFFSLLRPGAHIPPHHGMLNSRLICHLPLIVPPGGWLRVGGETRHWQEGRLLVFDDSIEHEARNPADALRVVLIFDIWRPELSGAERRGVSAIFDAIDAYSPNAAPQQGA